MIKEMLTLTLKSASFLKIRNVFTIFFIAFGICSFAVVNDLSNKFLELSEESILDNPNLSKIKVISAPEEDISHSDLEKVQSIKGVDEAYPVLSTGAFLKYKGTVIRDVTIENYPEKAEFLPNGQSFASGSSKGLIIPDISIEVRGETVDLGSLADNQVTITQLKADDNGVNSIEVDYHFQVRDFYNTKEKLHHVFYASTEQVIKLMASKRGVPEGIVRDTLRYNEVVSYVKDPETIDQVAGEINQLGFETSYVQKEIDNLAPGLKLLTNIVKVISVILLLLGVLGISNTVALSVHNRTKEFGIMKAIGLSNRLIMGMVVVETAVMIVVGGLISLILVRPISSFLEYYLGKVNLIENYSPSPLVFVYSAFLIMVITVLSSIIPIYRAVKINPIDALRHD